MSDDVDPEADFEREVDPGVSEQYRKASPWPMFVALGFVLSEVGVILGFFPVTVGGLLLFGGTVAAILRESGYIASPWRALVSMGVFLGAAGGLLVVLWWDAGSAGLLGSATALLDPANGVVYRGSAISVSGVFLVAVGLALRVAGRDPL